MPPTPSRLVNFGWLSSAQIGVLLFRFIGAILVTRYLGEQLAGVLSSYTALTVILIQVAGFGLRPVAISRFVREPDRSAITAGTLLSLQAIATTVALVAGLVIAFGLMGATSVAVDQERLVALLVLISLVPLPISNTTLWWLEAHRESRRLSLAQVTASVVVLAMRLSLVLLGAELWWFALTIAVGPVVRAASLWAWARPTLRRPAVSRPAGIRSMTKAGAVLVLGSTAVIAHRSIDIILLRVLDSNVAAGEYAAASGMSEVLYAVPAIIVTLAYPRIVEVDRARQNNDGSVYQLYARAMAMLGYLIAVPGILLGPTAARLAFGSGFEQTPAILQIQMLSLVFIFLQSMKWSILLARDHHGLYTITNLTALIFNVVGNILVIPRFGAVGSAWVTFASYGVASILMSFVAPESRSVGRLQMSAILRPTPNLKALREMLLRRA